MKNNSKKRTKKKIIAAAVFVVLVSIFAFIYYRNAVYNRDITEPLSAEQIIQFSDYRSEAFEVKTGPFGLTSPVVMEGGRYLSLSHDDTFHITFTSQRTRISDTGGYEISFTAMQEILSVLKAKGFVTSYEPGDYVPGERYDFSLTALRDDVQACSINVALNTASTGSDLVISCANLDNGRLQEFGTRDSEFRELMQTELEDNDVLTFRDTITVGDQYERVSAAILSVVTEADGTYTLDFTKYSNLELHWFYREKASSQWKYRMFGDQPACESIAGDEEIIRVLQDIKCTGVVLEDGFSYPTIGQYYGVE